MKDQISGLSLVFKGKDFRNYLHRKRVILLKHKFRWCPAPAEHFLEVGVVLGVLEGEHVGGELFFTEIIFNVSQLHGGGSFLIVY